MFEWKRNFTLAACGAFFLISANANDINKDNTVNSSETVTSQLSARSNDTYVQLLKYDEPVYELAYQIFLQNNNIQDAFAIAVAAVDQQPDNLIWRQRLVTVSMWYNEPVVALNQYLYLAEHFQDTNSFMTGMELAKKIHEDESLSQFIALDIKNGNNKQSVWQDYISTLLRIGELQLAINQLISHRQKLAPEFYLSQLIGLYEDLAEIDLERKTLNQYDEELGANPYTALKQVTIDLTTGNVSKAFKHLHAVRKKADNDNTVFWQTYAQMSWLKGSKAQTIHAYQVLLSQSKPKPEMFERLVNLYIHDNPHRAYYYAKLGRNTFPQNLLLTQNVLNLAAFTGRWDDITRLMPIIPLKVKQQLNNDPNYWLLMLDYWQQRSHYDQSAWGYQKAMRRFPDNDELKSGYIQWLIQNNRLNLVVPLLATLPKSICLSSALWGAYAAGYARLHNPAMTLAIVGLYRNQLANFKNDPYWLIGFKDFLEQSFLFTEANQVSHYAWPIYLKLLITQKQPIDYDQLINYAKLSIDEAPGDPSAEIFSILQKNLTPDAAELMLSWALAQKNYSLADEIYAYYLHANWLPPPQLALTLALYHRDNYLTRDLLIHHAAVISAEDRIEAAKNIDAIPLAQDLAYQSMSEQPHNSDFYDHYFTPLMLKSAARISLSQQYYQFGPEEGPRTIADATVWLTPGIAVTPYASMWLLKNTSEEDLATVPPHDDRAGVKALITQHRGDLLIDLGYRDNLDSFITAKLSRSYLITQNLTALFTAGYNQQADDTAALLIGGVKDELVGNLNYDLTARDLIQAEYAQNFFYTQNGQYLANGQQQTLRYKHQFWLSYPDLGLGAYGTAAQYFNRGGTLTGSALSLVPAGTEPNADFFIPPNFIEYGVTAEFGQNFHEDYTYRWRPFASVTIMNNTVAGFGRLYDVGIAGAVFGKDHLALYFEEGVNQSVGVNKSQLIEIMYQFYL